MLPSASSSRQHTARASPYRQEATPTPGSEPSAPSAPDDTAVDTAPPAYRSPSLSPTRPRARGPRPLPTTPGGATTTSAHQARQPRAQPQRQLSVADQCWICYGESTPEEGLWQHCKCTLVAHPKCLLHWVASSDNSHCPVCATPYKILQDPPSRFLVYYRAFRRRADKASVAIAIMGTGVGGWAAMTAYSAWAIRLWAGDWAASQLLFRESWPLSYYLNLPLIPLTLILSRTPLLDSFLPFLPLTLLLPSPHQRYFPPTTALTSLSFTYPPSPTLTLCLLPWLRLVYFRLRRATFTAVLGPRAYYPGLAGLIAELSDDEQSLRDQAAQRGPVDGRDEEDEDHDGEHNGRNRVEVIAELAMDPPAADDQRDHARDGGEAAPFQADRIRIGLARLSSLVVGALLFPAFAGGAGALLYWLAMRNGGASRGQGLLKKILGLSAIGLAQAASPGSPNASGWSWLWKAPFFLSTPAIPRNRPIDPLWIRTTVGGGLLLLVRDAFQLTAGLLEDKRRKSRKVVGKEVVRGKLTRSEEAVGVDGRVSSGGVDERTGRRAVVHTLL